MTRLVPWIRLTPGAPNLRYQLKFAGLPWAVVRSLEKAYLDFPRAIKARKEAEADLRRRIAIEITKQLPF